MTDSTLANEDTGSSENNQAQAEKTYSQKDVDDMMARMKSSLQKKLLKPYEDLGDPNELRELRDRATKQEQEQQMKRGEFDKIIQDLAAKKDAEIQKRDAIIKDYKINTPLLSAAAQYQAVNAEQVKALLAANLRLSQEGEVEVVDSKGSVRYSDKGQPLGVNDLVREFLDSNPHFRAATPATTNTRSNIAGSSSNMVDVSKLDMKRPEHRKLFADAKAKGKVK